MEYRKLHVATPGSLIFWPSNHEIITLIAEKRLFGREPLKSCLLEDLDFSSCSDRKSLGLIDMENVKYFLLFPFQDCFGIIGSVCAIENSDNSLTHARDMNHRCYRLGFSYCVNVKTGHRLYMI